MLRPLFTLRSPAGSRGRLSILIFHRVLARADPLFPEEVDARRFDAICGWLRSWFNVLPLDRAVALLSDGRLPARAAAITFDDGYADNHELALPILQRHGLHATFFIATGFLDGGRMFNDSVIDAIRLTALQDLDLRDLDLGFEAPLSLAGEACRRVAIERILPKVKYLPLPRRQATVDALVRRCGASLPRDLMMSRAQVRALHRAGMGIGGHTRSHPILARLDEESQRAEILGGKRDLEAILDAPVSLFAYPNGKPVEDYSAVSVRVVRSAGFSAAVSTAWGAASAAMDRFQLPRFTPWDRDRYRFAFRLLGNLARPMSEQVPVASRTEVESTAIG